MEVDYPELARKEAWRRLAALERDRAELIEALRLLESIFGEGIATLGAERRALDRARALLSRLEKDRT